MARFGAKPARRVAEEPGFDNPEDEVQAFKPEPGTEIVGPVRDEGGLIVPEVRPVYAGAPVVATVSTVLCTGCKKPIPIGDVLMDPLVRPWCSPECHADWGGA